ncbi:MAG: hypothetical protein R3Y68_10065 [Rikenellaceae bacterium]
MIKRIAAAVAVALALFATGCSKDDDNDIVETWRGNYTFYGANDDGDFVELTQYIVFVFENDYDVIKQSAVYEGSTLIESQSTVKYGTYSRTSDKIILRYDECDCTVPCICLDDDYILEEYYYRYTYYEDEEYDEDEDEESEDDSYGTLELRLVDEDDPYTEWVMFRYSEWVN